MPCLRRLSHYASETWKRHFQSGWKRVKCSHSIIRWGNFETQQPPVIWISVWARLGERNHVIMVTSSFMKSSAKPSFSNSSCLKSIFENEKLCFRDGLVWTVGLTINIKLRFEISPCGWRFKFFFGNFSHTNPSLIKVLYNLSTEGLIPECCGHFQLVRWHAGWLNTSSRQRTLEWSWYGKWTLSTEHALLFYLSKSKN